MSTVIDTVRTEREGEADERDQPHERGPDLPPARWVTGDETASALDVSDVAPDRVAAYARQADADVHFERKGGRTYLVAA